MNRIKISLETLLCLLVFIRCTGCSSHLGKIYSRLNQDSQRGLDKADRSERYNYPLDKLMNRLGYNSSKEAISTPSNIIDYNFDRISRNYSNGGKRDSTPSPVIEAPNSVATSAGNAVWRKRSVSGQRQRVTREEFPKDSKRKKFAGEERSYERKALYEESEDNEEEDEDEPMEEEEDGYQDLDPISYDTDHRNVRHGASYTRFEQSEPDQHPKLNQQLSPMTKKKWELLGSAKKVDELFQAIRKNGGVRKVGISEDWIDPHPKKQAENHVLKIMKDGRCKFPRQKLIKVSESYPSMSKTYTPSCTILFRCGDDTGCCSLPTQKCTAKNSTTVELYFTTTRVEARDGNRTVRHDIEKLTFTNDTECDCVEMMPRDMELDRLLDHKPKTGCTCPTEFSARYMSNGSCTCDCFDKQNDCLRYKRGLKYFDHQDRLCIAEGGCEKPLCRFGVYEHKYGRCPKRHEKFQKFSRYAY